MTHTHVRRPVPPMAALLVIAALALALPVPARAQEGAFDRTLTVTGPVDLDVQSGSGRIRVEPGAAGAVRISAKLKADNWLPGADVEQRLRQIEQNPPIEQQGNVIRVGHFADMNLPRNISISYDITVPAETKLAASTGSGSVAVGAIAGPATLRSGSGSVTAGKITKAVTVATGSGSINLDGAGSLDASAGSGSIHAAGVAGPVSAKAGSGSVTVTQTEKGDVSVSTGSGGIRLQGVNGAARVSSGSGGITIDGRPAGPWQVHVASGGITLAVPPDAAFDLDAHSNSGDIDSAIPVTMTVSGTIDKHRVQGKVRGGGPLVQLSAASGNIRIR
jgi:DUF4097 and DUF4098 domain-containing protein YvlB